MSARDFFAQATKTRVAEAIAKAESRTGAEVVVVVRASSGHYRHVDYLGGLAVAFAALVVFLFHPMEFATDWFPVEFAGLFAVGAIATGQSPPLRRALASRALRERQVATSARAAFVDLGVSRTRARTGLLVYASMLERRVEVVCDVGLDEGALGAAWPAARAALAAAVAKADAAAFVAAIEALEDALAEGVPRAAGVDDVDELANEVRS